MDLDDERAHGRRRTRPEDEAVAWIDEVGLEGGGDEALEDGVED